MKTFDELLDSVGEWNDTLLDIYSKAEETIFKVISPHKMSVTIGNTSIKGAKEIEFKFISDIIVKTKTLYPERIASICFKTVKDTVLNNGNNVIYTGEDKEGTHDYVTISYTPLSEIEFISKYNNIIKVINNNLLDIFLANVEDYNNTELYYIYKDVNNKYDTLNKTDAIFKKYQNNSSRDTGEYIKLYY